MVDSDTRWKNAVEANNPHRDGKIELGNHSDRLAELTGQPTPESFPTKLFELQDGQVTLEQVRILHFFLQEYRNKEATLRNRPYLFSRYIQKYESTQTAADEQTLKAKALENRKFLEELDFMTGEAEELMEVLTPILKLIDAGQGPMISPEERQRRILEASEEIKALEAERAQTEQLQSAQRTEVQKARYSYSSARIDELKVIRKSYEVPSQEVTLQMSVLKKAELKSLVQEREATGDPSQDEKIQELQDAVTRLDAMLADYDGFVAAEMQKPVLSAEAQRLRNFVLDLKLAIAEYKGPLIPGVNVDVPDKAAVLTLLKHPEVTKLLPDIAKGL